jgi:hypothetical protein
MRTAWAGLVALAAALTLTSCRNNSLDGTATASPSPTAAGTAGAVPVCVTGTWRSTSATVVDGATGDGMTGTLAGGRGVVLTIGGNGAAKVDFTSMQPMSFAVSTDAGDVKGLYSYSGTATGTLQFPTGTSPEPTAGALPSVAPSLASSASPAAVAPASPAAVASAGTGAGAPGETGTWRPAGDVTWDGLRLTVKLTEPFNQTIVDNARIRAVSNNQTDEASNAVDLQPVLREGAYACHDGTLTVRSQAGPATVTWAFRRA